MAEFLNNIGALLTLTIQAIGLIIGLITKTGIPAIVIGVLIAYWIINKRNKNS